MMSFLCFFLLFSLFLSKRIPSLSFFGHTTTKEVEKFSSFFSFFVLFFLLAQEGIFSFLRHDRKKKRSQEKILFFLDTKNKERRKIHSYEEEALWSSLSSSSSGLVFSRPLAIHTQREREKERESKELFSFSICSFI